MSLCVAWRYEDVFCLASDTCVSVGQRTMPFGCIKVLAVPVKVVGPINFHSREADIVYERTMGFAYVGGFLGSFLLKEIVADILSHLQTLDPDSVSMEKISAFVFRFYEHFVEQMESELGSGDMDFFFGGWCPTAHSIKMYKFHMDFVTQKPTYREVLNKSPFSFDAIGGGEPLFRKHMSEDLQKGDRKVHFDVARNIKRVIEDESVPSVGGTIQFGDFQDDGEFVLVGVQDPIFENGEVVPKSYVRGTDLDVIRSAEDLSDLSVTYSFKAPFQDEMLKQIDSSK